MTTRSEISSLGDTKTWPCSSCWRNFVNKITSCATLNTCIVPNKFIWSNKGASKIHWSICFAWTEDKMAANRFLCYLCVTHTHSSFCLGAQSVLSALVACCTLPPCKLKPVRPSQCKLGHCEQTLVYIRPKCKVQCNFIYRSKVLTGIRET